MMRPELFIADEDLAQMLLEERLGQIECVGRHAQATCTWCKAAV